VSRDLDPAIGITLGIAISVVLWAGLYLLYRWLF
jgi:hypothetical protein